MQFLMTFCLKLEHYYKFKKDAKDISRLYFWKKSSQKKRCRSLHRFALFFFLMKLTRMSTYFCFGNSRFTGISLSNSLWHSRHMSIVSLFSKNLFGYIWCFDFTRSPFVVYGLLHAQQRGINFLLWWSFLFPYFLLWRPNSPPQFYIWEKEEPEKCHMCHFLFNDATFWMAAYYQPFVIPSLGNHGSYHKIKEQYHWHNQKK